jgi:ribose transport system substrate-binding protein
MRSDLRLPAIAAAMLLAAALAGCGKQTGSDRASGSGNSSSGDTVAAKTAGLDTLPTGTDKLCGNKPIKIAHVDGFGANSWRKTVREELKAELAPCKNVSITYSDAGGDVQKFNAAINSYVAKGYDGLVVFDDFGEQGLAALRNAMKAGMAVVPYVGEPGGTPGTDYTVFIAEDKPKVGQQYAEWLAKVLKGKGNVIFMGGAPGNTSTPAFFNPFAKALDGTGLKLLVDKAVDTNWDPGQEQRVMAGLISKYKKIDGLASDYGVASGGGLRAFVNANEPHPPLATNASDNNLGCQWLKYHKQWPGFQLYTLDGSTRVVRWAGRRALATINKLELGDPTVFQLYPLVDTANGKLPKCNPDLPPDADLSSALSPEALKALFG